VYEDGDGWQYVRDPDGERVNGVWLLPADEPAVVESRLRVPLPCRRTRD
jgi:hypothetical protein